MWDILYLGENVLVPILPANIGHFFGIFFLLCGKSVTFLNTPFFVCVCVLPTSFLDPAGDATDNRGGRSIWGCVCQQHPNVTAGHLSFLLRAISHIYTSNFVRICGKLCNVVCFPRSLLRLLLEEEDFSDGLRDA